LHQSLKEDDAASLRRVAPSFLFIQATLRNVAAHECSRLSDALGGKRGTGGNRCSIPPSAFAPLSAGESGLPPALLIIP
ncbi:MAG: hypothetical protein IKK57_05785, partial [Clostridia bacterium]|nr:hypothetical protein [Clostridia bacterium]